MIEYKKFRWFYTSSKTLVVGGKNAEQNDFLLKELKKDRRDYLVMHTTRPRSPFSVILKEDAISEQELQECAVFTACFSSAWKDRAKETGIDVFRMSQLGKGAGFKAGLWSVKGKVERMKAGLELAFTVQENTLRAVPLKSVKKQLLVVRPGKIDKEQMAEEIARILGGKFTKEQIISALPAGGVNIVK